MRSSNFVKKESMSTYIKPAFQIQRINELEHRLEQIKEAPYETLKQRRNPKAWSPIEVAKHMVLAHMAYTDKVNRALKMKTNTSVMASEFKAAAIPSFLIKRFPPKNGVITFKMKTTRTFKPVLDVEHLNHQQIETVLSELESVLKELKGWIEQYRTHPVSLKKFNSAIGAVVRFNIPEACEFILCHNERHFLQLERALTS